MSDMKFFQSSNGCKCRVFIRDGEPWFVAKDVCENIGLNDVSRACAPLDDDEKTMLSKKQLPENFSGSQNAYHFLLISEPGLYALVMRSSKPEAKKFQRWVTHDVLPAIRRNGVYATPEAVQALTPEEIMARAVLAAQETIKRIEAERDEAIKARGRISSAREASLMSRWGHTKEENEKLKVENETLKTENIELKDKLGEGQTAFRVTTIPWVRKYFYNDAYTGNFKVGIYNRLGTALGVLSRDKGVEIKKVRDEQGRDINVYKSEIVEEMEQLIIGKRFESKAFRMVTDYLRPAYR